MILLLVLLVTYIDAQFINSSAQADKKSGCSGDTSSVNFNWNYATSTSVLGVVWKKDGSKIAEELVGLSQPFSPVGSYIGRLTRISNAQISLVNLSIADSGIYTCEVTYTNGNAYSSNSVSLSVYDEWNNETKIQMTSGNGMVTLSAVFFDLSITYTWKLQNTVIYVGFSLAVKKNGNYTLCLSGGRADCINSSISPCASIDVTGLDDCSQDIFLYGFLPVFLIVLIASIPINILKIDFLSKQFGEFAWKKVGITAVFCVIAIIIGVCLGLLIKGCDKKLLALGLSLFFGILLVVALIFALIYYHKKCESGSDIQDGDGGEDSNRSSQNNTGSNTTRTGTGRVGSPASTSNVELAANLKSES